MIAEPYICIKGDMAGEIEWLEDNAPAVAQTTIHMDNGNTHERYADFEREKLKEINGRIELRQNGFGIVIMREENCITNHVFVPGCYDSYQEWLDDTESNRLLKRAEFLKVVCEKEGVEWLPKPVEYRACEKCRNPFPCAHSFRGTPICDDCFDSKSWCHCGNPKLDGMHQIQGSCECEKQKLKAGVLYAGEDESSLKEVGEIENMTIEITPNPDRNNWFWEQWKRSMEDKRYWKRMKFDVEEEVSETTVASTNEEIHYVDPVRDYYTKQEIDERMMSIFDLLLDCSLWLDSSVCDASCLKEKVCDFRSRFLS